MIVVDEAKASSPLPAYNERTISMEKRGYQTLNPGALAIASGFTAIVISFLIGLPMMGFGSMMGAYYGTGWMMGGYGPGFIGFGLMWIVGGLVAALGGALVAWVYNAVNASQHKESGGIRPENGSQLPTAREQ
jgi:phosphate/sulfate permease